jgi:uncharacterized membrane protein
MKRFIAQVFAVFGAVMLLPVAAMASTAPALPAGVDQLFADTDSLAQQAIDKGWPLMLTIVGGLVIFGIVKKVIRKAV